MEIGIPMLLTVIGFCLVFSQNSFKIVLISVYHVNILVDASELNSCYAPLRFILMQIVVMQYLKHIKAWKDAPILERFCILLSIAIIWMYSYILTVGGAYRNVPEKTKESCRTDRAHLISSAPWYTNLVISSIDFHLINNKSNKTSNGSEKTPISAEIHVVRFDLQVSDNISNKLISNLRTFLMSITGSNFPIL